MGPLVQALDKRFSGVCKCILLTLAIEKRTPPIPVPHSHPTLQHAALLAAAVTGGAAFWLVSRRRRGRGPRSVASDLKFSKFLDDESALETGDSKPGQPSFYEAVSMPASPGPPVPSGQAGVELSGRPGTGGSAAV